MQNRYGEPEERSSRESFLIVEGFDKIARKFVKGLESFQRLREDECLARLKDEDERRRKKVEAGEWFWRESPFFMIILQNPEDKFNFISGHANCFDFGFETFIPTEACHHSRFVIKGMGEMDLIKGWKTWSRDMKPIAEAILCMVESKFDKEFGGCKNGIMKS